MNSYDFQRFIGALYIIGGLILFFFVMWHFLIRLVFGLLALYFVYTGLKMRSFSFAQLFFRASQYKNRYRNGWF